METFINKYFNQLKIGDMEKFEGLQIFPLFSDVEYKVEYLMMKEALKQGVLIVEEVSSSGSVPNLSAINKSELPILLLGGEELEGAKQNRVLNMSILLPPESKTVIPVSCVEQGRWSYRKKKFDDSGNFAYKQMREASYQEIFKDEVVRQQRVWEDVRTFERSMEVSSPTSAMKDVFEAKEKEFSEYDSKFNLHDKQIGLLAVSNGMILGFDIIGRAEKFAIVFRKLMKSYVVEDMMKETKVGSEITKEKVKEFFNLIVEAKEKRVEGVGLGYDYRYNSEKIVGSALSFKKEIIHSVFFAKENQNYKKTEDENERFESLRYRRRNLDTDDI
jgi:hypothetical protein